MVISFQEGQGGGGEWPRTGSQSRWAVLFIFWDGAWEKPGCSSEGAGSALAESGEG